MRGQSAHGSHGALISFPVMPSLAAEARKTTRREGSVERSAAARLLLDCSLVERTAHTPRACFEDLFEQPGVQRPRCDGVDVDPSSCSSSASVSAKRTTAAFDAAYALRRGSGRSRRPGELDDLAVPVRPEVGQHGASAEDGPEEVHPYGVLPFVPVNLLDEPFWPVDARVVHEYLDLREALDCSRPTRRSDRLRVPRRQPRSSRPSRVPARPTRAPSGRG